MSTIENKFINMKMISQLSSSDINRIYNEEVKPQPVEAVKRNKVRRGWVQRCNMYSG